MPQMPAWSYSSLTAFETCPRRYYLTRVTKQVVEPQTEATTHGNEVHKAFEVSIKTKVPLPAKYAEWQPIADTVTSVRGKQEAELKIALDANMAPTTWFSKTAWCRGIIDLHIEDGDKAIAFDWKTGKRKPDSTQLKLFAGLLFQARPYLKKVSTAFVWLKDGKLDKDRFSRESLPEIWGEFLPRVKRMESAYDRNKWPAQPSGLCRNWCPCTGCEFNGKYKGE